jgi:hypothetical protein
MDGMEERMLGEEGDLPQMSEGSKKIMRELESYWGGLFEVQEELYGVPPLTEKDYQAMARVLEPGKDSQVFVTNNPMVKKALDLEQSKRQTGHPITVRSYQDYATILDELPQTQREQIIQNSLDYAMELDGQNEHIQHTLGKMDDKFMTDQRREHARELEALKKAQREKTTPFEQAQPDKMTLRESDVKPGLQIGRSRAKQQEKPQVKETEVSEAPKEKPKFGFNRRKKSPKDIDR